jgi:hypothetical protein
MASNLGIQAASSFWAPDAAAEKNDLWNLLNNLKSASFLARDGRKLRN